MIPLIHVLPGQAFAAEPGSRRADVYPALEVFDAARTPREYRESAALLESLLVDGFRNGAVYYNLGNAYFRAGEYGRAIAAYRKAKPYRPRDPYLEANLRQALSVAPGRLAEPPPPWWSHVLFWSGWLSFPEKAYASFAGFLLAALAAWRGSAPLAAPVLDQHGTRCHCRRFESGCRPGLCRSRLVAAWRGDRRNDRPQGDWQGL